jgi:hypothetical protein
MRLTLTAMRERIRPHTFLVTQTLSRRLRILAHQRNMPLGDLVRELVTKALADFDGGPR